jgi:hypothetical protein
VLETETKLRVENDVILEASGFARVARSPVQAIDYDTANDCIYFASYIHDQYKRKPREKKPLKLEAGNEFGE